MDPQTGAPFETTRWTLLSAFHRGDDAERKSAREQLISLYWPAVYGYLRRNGVRSEQAMEVTQAFFVDVVLSRKLFEQADPDRGRLRSLLLTALRRYRIDRARRAKSHPDWDGPDPSTIHAVDSRAAGAESPECAFEKEWALRTLDEARRRCEAHFVETGRGAHWRAFEARHITPFASGAHPRPLSEIAQEFGFQSDASLASVLQVVRKRFRVLLEEVMVEQDAVNAESEMGLVLALLSA